MPDATNLPNIIDSEKVLAEFQHTFPNYDGKSPAVIFFKGLGGFLSAEFLNSVTRSILESHKLLAARQGSRLFRHDLVMLAGGIALATVFYFWPVEEVAAQHARMVAAHALAEKRLDKLLDAKKAELNALQESITQKEAANAALAEKQNLLRIALGKITGGEHFVETSNGKWAIEETEYNTFWEEKYVAGDFFKHRIHYVELPVYVRK